MKNLKLFILAVLAVSAFGCTKELEGQNPETGVVRIIGATLDSIPELKTTLDPIAGGSKQVIWSTGDEIGVVVKGSTTIRKGTLSSGAGTSKGTFSIAGATAEEEYSYAIYPYSYAGTGGSTAPTISGSKFTVTLPNRQVIPNSGTAFTDKVFTNKMNTMVGKFNGDEVNMTSTCGILKTQISMSTGSSTLWSLQVQSDSKRISGLGTIDMSEDTPVVKMGTANTSFNYIYFQPTIDITETGVPISTTSKAFYLIMPVGDYSDIQFNVAVGTTSLSLNSTKTHTISRSKITALKNIEVDTKNKDLYTNYTDLCLDESGNAAYANSYLVKPDATEKAYRVAICFPKGGKILYRPDNTEVYKYTENVQLIWTSWETENQLIRNLRKEGNYIYFTVKPGATGCALLSAANTGMNIRWSTLIWVSDAKEQTMLDGVVLDRDLGAGFAPASQTEAESMTVEQSYKCRGVLYQWGCPLPKAGICMESDVNYSANTYVYHPHSRDQYGVKWTASTGAGLMEKIYLYPNYYYSSNGSWNTAKGTEKVITTGTSAFWRSSEKSDLDPCPVGYRIANKAVFGHAFTNFESGYGTKTYKFIYGHVGGIYATSNSNFVFFPWTGVRLAGWNDNQAYIGDQNDYYDIKNYSTKETMYPRVTQWAVDDNVTTSDLAGKTIRYGKKAGGGDIKGTDASGYTDVTMFIWYATGGTLKYGEQTATPGNLFWLDQRLFISAALPVRCMKNQ